MEKPKKKKIDILFVLPPYHRRNGSGAMFPLGIGSIMAFLEKENTSYDFIDCTEIIETLDEENLLLLNRALKKELQRFDPCLVGIGPCVTPGVKGLVVVAQCCINAFGKQIVFAGGPFTLLQSQEWFFFEKLGLKYIIKGDGENAVCAAIKTLKSGKALCDCDCVSTPKYSKVNIIKNLDELPFPKRIRMEKYVFSDRRKLAEDGRSAHIVASRGCPYQCDYCVSGNLRIPFRKRSVTSIVAEMEELSVKFGVTDFIFYDDCFFTSAKTAHDEIKEFCAAIKNKKLHVTWQIEIRPDIIMCIADEEFRLLSECGCRQMNVGVEKTYPDGASLFGKKYDFEKLKKILAHIHDICPILLAGTFILGGKGETVDSVRKLIYASANMNLDKAEYSPLFVYPDTPIYQDLFLNPRSWYEVVMQEKEAWGEVVYEYGALSKNVLIDLVDEAYGYFYGNTNQYDSKRIQDRYRLKGLRL